MLKNKRFEMYLLKNRIWGLVLSVLITAVFLLMAFHFDLADRLRTQTYRSMSEIEESGTAGNVDVQITLDRADYLGYDYYDGATREGGYYYCKQDGQYAILLLRSNEDVVLGYTLRGRVLQPDSAYDEIAADIADDIGIDAAQLKKSMYKFVISEIDFPRMYYIGLFAALMVSVLLCVWNVVGCVMCMIFPWKQKRVRTALGRDTDKGVIKDIDSQLRYNVYFDRDWVAVTDSYFIYHGAFHTDIVRLSSIEAYKKLRTSPNIGPGNKHVYKLLMTDVDGVTYEQNFKTEKTLDEVIACVTDGKS